MAETSGSSRTGVDVRSDPYSRDVELQLAALLDLMAEAFLILDGHGECVYHNAAATLLLQQETRKRSTEDAIAIPAAIARLAHATHGMSGGTRWLPAITCSARGTRLRVYPLRLIAGDGRAFIHCLCLTEGIEESIARRAGKRAGLSLREGSVLKRLVDGRTKREIAAELDLSVHTVRTYVERIYTKFDVEGREELLKSVLRLASLPISVPTAADIAASFPNT